MIHWSARQILTPTPVASWLGTAGASGSLTVGHEQQSTSAAPPSAPSFSFCVSPPPGDLLDVSCFRGPLHCTGLGKATQVSVSRLPAPVPDGDDELVLASAASRSSSSRRCRRLSAETPWRTFPGVVQSSRPGLWSSRAAAALPEASSSQSYPLEK